VVVQGHFVPKLRCGQDREEEALIHIQDAEGQSDYSISNDGTLFDMHNTIEKLVRDNRLLDSNFYIPTL
jgi:hypothetical protein